MKQKAKRKILQKNVKRVSQPTCKVVVNTHLCQVLGFLIMMAGILGLLLIFLWIYTFMMPVKVVYLPQGSEQSQEIISP